MAKGKKPNPKKIPVTMADVRRAEQETQTSTMRHALELVLFILVDKHDAPAEDVQQLAREITNYSRNIVEGRLSWNYIHKILEENNVEVRLV